MLHKSPNIIHPKTWDILVNLQSDSALKDFFLVGGTSLALQIGHRLSIDLDLFTLNEIDTNFLNQYLQKNYAFFLSAVEPNTLLGFIEEVKVDFITHAYPLVEPLLIEEGVRLASLMDIAAMKLNAIALSGQRLKDFIDLYYLLEKLSLNTMLKAYEIKYPQSNLLIALKAISYFEDIDPDIDPPKLIQPLPLDTIKKRILKAIKKPGLIFVPSK